MCACTGTCAHTHTHTHNTLPGPSRAPASTQVRGQKKAPLHGDGGKLGPGPARDTPHKGDCGRGRGHPPISLTGDSKSRTSLELQLMLAKHLQAQVPTTNSRQCGKARNRREHQAWARSPSPLFPGPLRPRCLASAERGALQPTSTERQAGSEPPPQSPMPGPHQARGDGSTHIC